MRGRGRITKTDSIAAPARTRRPWRGEASLNAARDGAIAERGFAAFGHRSDAIRITIASARHTLKRTVFFEAEATIAGRAMLERRARDAFQA